MENGFITAVYVTASVLFILALGGMSNQESAKRSIWYGIVGMALAVMATLFDAQVDHYWLIAIMVGGWCGYRHHRGSAG